METLGRSAPWVDGAERRLRIQLGRIVASPEFCASRRLRDILEYLFEKSLAGCAEGISQYSIAFECLKMGVDFNAEQNSLVRSHTRRLRRALEAYHARAGSEDEVVILLPTPGYALLFERRRPEEASGKPLRQEWPVLALVEFKGLGLEGAWRQLPALLAEELSGVITGTGGLRFIGPFSRAVLDAEGIDTFQLASRHRFDFMLDGSVQGVGDSLIIRTRLMDGKTGLQIWAGKDQLSLDGPDFAGFEVRLMGRLAAEIGGDIGQISTHLSAFARVKPENALTVYESVLMGRMYLSDFHYESLPQAVAALRRVVREMPDEPAPHATLAVLLATLGAEPRWPGDPPPEEIRALAARARHLDPADPWSILASAFSAVYEQQPDELERIGRSVSADPQATSMVQACLGGLLCFQKVDVATGLLLIERALQANPHCVSGVHLARSLVFLDAGRLEAALVELDAYGVPWGWADPLLRAVIAGRQGNPESARAEWLRVLAAFPEFETHGPRSIGYLWHADYVALAGEVMRGAGVTIRAVPA
ncbi:hypothetical protein HQ447_18135 [bacterium]|nr:hypothetical protein [bacterium]